MSVKAMAFVFGLQGLDPRDKFVALAYADHADHDGRNIWPAVASVAEKTGYSERTVQRATAALEEAGLLLADGLGPDGTNKWCLNLDWRASIASEGGGDNVTPRQADTPPVRLTPEPSFVVVDTLSKETEQQQQMTDGVSGCHPRQADTPPDGLDRPEQQIFDLLRGSGVSKSVAEELAGTCDLQDVEGWIRYIGGQAQLRNPAGLLVAALRAGDRPPEGAQALSGDLEDPTRYMRGRFAEFVES